MNFFLILLSLAFVSCGKITNPVTGSGIGELRTVSALTGVSAGEQAAIQEICQGLQTVQNNLPSSVGTLHVFEVKQTNCDGGSVESSTQSVVIQSAGSGYMFKRQEGTEFLFPVIETLAQGDLSLLCGGGANLTNPLPGSEGSATFFTVLGNVPECSAKVGERCVLLEKARLEAGLSYRIVSRDILRIRVDQTLGKVGFITFRKKYAQSFCPIGKSITLEASLK